MPGRWRRFREGDKQKEAEKKGDFSHLDTSTSAELRQEIILTQAELQYVERVEHENRTATAKRKLAYLEELLKKFK